MNYFHSIASVILCSVIILLAAGCSERSTNAPNQTVTLSGSIIDQSTNRPIVDAKITVTESDKGTQLAQEKTDQAGYFKIENLPRVKLTAVIEASGYNTVNQTVYDPAQPEIKSTELMIPMIAAILEDCCSGVFTGTVVDQASVPIVGAVAKLWKGGNLIKTGTTDADGKVVFDSLCHGEYAVHVTKDGYIQQGFTFIINQNCDPVAKTIVLQTSPCCTGHLALTVNDQNGSPISGATVKVYKSGALIKTETTNSNGQVVVTSLCHGEYTVHVTKDGYQEQDFTFIINQNCDPVAKTIVLQTSPCCTGHLFLTVNDQNGSPISGATVKVYKSGTLIKTETTNSNGQVVVTALCHGEYAVIVTKDGYIQQDFSFIINQNCDPIAKTIVLNSSPCCTGHLTLTVNDQNGSPISGATVKVYKSGALIKTETTNSNGQVVVTSLCHGEYTVHVTKAGYQEQDFTFIINQNCDPVAKTIVLQTSPCCTGHLFLTVNDQNGSPISGATVKVYKSGVLIKTETTNSNGQVVVTALCHGEYAVIVTKDGYIQQDFSFIINQNCDPVAKTIVLQTSPCCTGHLFLTVNDQNGSPISGATVKVYKSGTLIKTETTNSNGQVVVTALCHGEYAVHVTKDGYIQQDFSFIINQNCDPVAKTIVLQTSPCCTGHLFLTVNNQNGSPISGATVKVYKSGVLIKTETTNSNGQVVVTNLCHGEYAVHVTKDGYIQQGFTFIINQNCDPVTKTIVLTQ